MLLRTRKRPGFSLTEVIVALFVMAAGIIALLTLFPLGAVQMGQALRDDRAQTTCLQADATLRMGWQQCVSENPPNGITYDYYNFSNSLYLAGISDRVPGNVVYFDPIGFSSYTGPLQLTVGQQNMIRRVSPSRHSVFPPLPGTSLNLGQSIRLCTMPDDLEFSRDPAFATPAIPIGSPAPPGETGSSSQVIRQGRYNWGAMLQYPDNSIQTVADLKILVFDRRAPGISPVDAEKPYSVNVNVGDTQIVLPFAIDTIPLRNRGWIFDGTKIDPVPAGQYSNPNAGTGIRNCNFYRIQSITELTPTSTLLELQTPIARPTGNTKTGSYNAQFYVFSNLIEVFDRPQLGRDGYQKQTP